MSTNGGFYKYRCKFFYADNCPQWVYVNNTACAICLARGKDMEGTESVGRPVSSTRLNLWSLGDRHGMEGGVLYHHPGHQHPQQSYYRGKNHNDGDEKSAWLWKPTEYGYDEDNEEMETNMADYTAEKKPMKGSPLHP